MLKAPDYNNKTFLSLIIIRIEKIKPLLMSQKQ